MRTPKLHLPDHVPTWQLPVSLLMGGVLALVGRYALQRTGMLDRIAALRLQTAFHNLRHTTQRPKYQPMPASNDQEGSNKLHGDPSRSQAAQTSASESPAKAKSKANNGAGKRSTAAKRKPNAQA